MPVAGGKSVIFGRKHLIIALKALEFHTKPKIISRFVEKFPKNSFFFPANATKIAGHIRQKHMVYLIAQDL